MKLALPGLALFFALVTPSPAAFAAQAPIVPLSAGALSAAPGVVSARPAIGQPGEDFMVWLQTQGSTPEATTSLCHFICVGCAQHNQYCCQRTPPGSCYCRASNGDC